MKRVENLILKSCAYTVLIAVLFFLFTLATSFTEAALTIGTFMIILLFGAVIAFSNLILELLPLKTFLKVLIHYATLLIAFIVIFVIKGRISAVNTAAIFSAIIIFTFLYAFFFLVAWFIRKSIYAADKRIDKRHPKKVSEKKEYKSLYK